jgi:TusA-related sulfurtransferase
MKAIDCRGQQCPQPVIQTRQTMLAEPGEVLQVLVDDQVCQDNVSRLAKTLGYEIMVSTEDSVIQLELTPGEQPEASHNKNSAAGPTIIFSSAACPGTPTGKCPQRSSAMDASSCGHWL